MKALLIGVTAAAVMTAACGTSPAQPTQIRNETAQIGAAAFSALAAKVSGSWAGQTRCDSDGSIAQLAAVFAEQPGNSQALKAAVTWSGAATYHGNAQGTLAEITINASDAGNGCNYKASGTVNDAGTTISGTYHAIGTCRADSGTFTLAKQ